MTIGRQDVWKELCSLRIPFDEVTNRMDIAIRLRVAISDQIILESERRGLPLEEGLFLRDQARLVSGFYAL